MFYDSQNLIDKIMKDIGTYGEEKRCVIRTINVLATEIITGYDISRDGRPIMSAEIKEGETLMPSTKAKRGNRIKKIGR